ncbi:hypothetical protein [Ureibacillus thermosphaericus]|uniref:hypothetical protein n=1 Tax=Ureibacillus thermosphaericus TaxID=51173 RepID=UPI000BBC2CFB|nr:hypothetical protein [Ureibacillus thermosphaericus]
MANIFPRMANILAKLTNIESQKQEFFRLANIFPRMANISAKLTNIAGSLTNIALAEAGKFSNGKYISENG